MAYWFVPGVNPGGSNQKQYMMDSDSDLTSLPTATSNGVKQADDVTHLPCGRGSMAVSIQSGTIYALNSQNEWAEFGAGGSGGGGSDG